MKGFTLARVGPSRCAPGRHLPNPNPRAHPPPPRLRIAAVKPWDPLSTTELSTLTLVLHLAG